jgi:hypothetical protein
MNHAAPTLVCRHRCPHPAYGLEQPAPGSRANPWRTIEARHSRRQTDDPEVHAQSEALASSSAAGVGARSGRRRPAHSASSPEACCGRARIVRACSTGPLPAVRHQSPIPSEAAIFPPYTGRPGSQAKEATLDAQEEEEAKSEPVEHSRAGQAVSRNEQAEACPGHPRSRTVGSLCSRIGQAGRCGLLGTVVCTVPDDGAHPRERSHGLSGLGQVREG